MAFTGSGWYLWRTFLVLMGNMGLCRITWCGKHRPLAGTGESPGIDHSSGASFWVLISLYVILYTSTISITDTQFSTYCFSVYNSRFWEVKLYLIASCFVITMALTGSDWNLRKTFLVLVETRGFVASTDAESFGPSLVLVSLLGSTLVLVGALGGSSFLFIWCCMLVQYQFWEHIFLDIVFRFTSADFEK